MDTAVDSPVPDRVDVRADMAAGRDELIGGRAAEAALPDQVAVAPEERHLEGGVGAGGGHRGGKAEGEVEDAFGGGEGGEERHF